MTGRTRNKKRTLKTRNVARPRGRIPRPRSIAVIQCDTEQLIRDSLSIAGRVSQGLYAAAPAVARYVIEATTQQDLTYKLGQCVEERRWAAPKHSALDFIILIGHSNRLGFQLASDKWAQWKDLGPWLYPLQPKRIALVACEAGRELPVRTLFDTVPSLREIYSTPGYASTNQVGVVTALTLGLMHTWNSQRDLIGLGTIITAAALNEPVFRWTRGKQSMELLSLVNFTATVRSLLKALGIWRDPVR
jgi:hypothetical protein